MFEEASRLKLRFDSPKGNLMVEDLWDLPLSGNGPNLDKIAIGLSRQLKEENTESFIVTSKKANTTLQLKFDVVKHIIDVRLAENEAAKVKAETRAKKERILAIIDRKQNEVLEGTSMEELQKMVAGL